MANPVGTFQTYQAVGNREDLTNLISNISPTDTPFQSMAKKTKATNKTHNWQKDSLRAAAANAQVEGDTPSNTTVVPTVNLFNATQISSYAFNISGTQQAVNPAGRADELAYQLVKYGKELKRDIEKNLTGNTAYAAGTSGTARVTGSLEAWMSSNWTTQGVSAGASASPGFSTTGVVAATDNTVTATVSEANVKAIIGQCWEDGGKPDVIMVGKYNKQKLSAFSGLVGMTNNIFQKADGQATLIAAVDAYQSDFGALKIIPNRFSRDRTVSILDMEYWAIAYLRPFQSFPLAKVGDSDQRMILAEYCLESREEAASGKVTDCATA
jgi:hypothetical protein